MDAERRQLSVALVRLSCLAHSNAGAAFSSVICWCDKVVCETVLILRKTDPFHHRRSARQIQAIESSEAARVRGDARDVAASRAYCMLGFDFPLVTVSDLNSLESELASADAAAYAR